MPAPSGYISLRGPWAISESIITTSSLLSLMPPGQLALAMASFP
jgi:hypothetical protein